MPGWQNELVDKGKPQEVNIPMRPFLYTLDQIAALLSVDTRALQRSYLFYAGRSTGARRKDLILAHNIAPEGDKPEWRVAERELVRWFRYKGFKVVDRSWVTH
jgi:hypothetical protein